MDVDLASVAAAYHRDGFAVMPHLLGRDEVAALNAEAIGISRGDRGEIIGAGAPADDESDEAFLGRILAIHFPHKISPLVRETMRHPRIIAVLRALIGANIKSMQTMLFVKRAGKPGQAWHQDEFFIPTRDRSLCGAWIALDDATIENGCLWMQPGSQEAGVLYPMERNDDARFDGTGEAIDFPYPRESGVPLPLEAGGVAFFNGHVLHRSLRNDAAGGFRRALVIHYCSAETFIPWAFGQAPSEASDFRDVEIVAGTDPYLWKGYKELMIPFVRQDDPQRQAEMTHALTEAQAALARSRAAA